MSITLITMYEKNRSTGKDELIVSHGLDEEMRVVILPTEHPASLGAVFDEEMREWILPECAIGSDQRSTDDPLRPSRQANRDDLLDWSGV
jgi:hypothetical protein